MEVLHRKQKSEDRAFSESDVLDLAFLVLISSQIPARRVWVAGGRGRPTRLYSDASFEPGDKLPGIGWILFKPGHKPEGRAALMPSSVMEGFRARKTKIYAAEVFAVLAVVYEHLQGLVEADAVFFVDNEAACAI